jgi:hypothetical protein
VDWQQVMALAIVAAAAYWLIRTQILAPRRGGGCGGCGSCPSAALPPSRSAGQGAPQLVQIEMDLGTAKQPEAQQPSR